LILTGFEWVGGWEKALVLEADVRHGFVGTSWEGLLSHLAGVTPARGRLVRIDSGRNEPAD
jgi:hypothetical protein